MAALVSVALLFVLAGPARAGCSIGDVVNAISNTLGAVDSGYCSSACATGGGCGASVAVTAVLGGVAADAGQGSVNSFCSDVNSLIQQISSGTDNANSVAGALQSATGSSVGQDLMNQLSAALADVASPLAVAQCACSVEQSLDQLGSDFGACLQDFLCAGDALLGSPCSCTPPPPITANCSQSLAQCGSFTDSDPGCLGGNQVPTLLAGQNGANIEGYVPVIVTNSSAGTLVTGGGSGSDGQGHCAPVFFCFCPKPMVPTWTESMPWIENNGFQEEGSQFYVFSCDCPSGTHPDPSSATVNGVSVCICDGTTSQVANFNPESFGGMCPPPACPSGQVRLSGAGKCVTPCSNPNEGMAFDGSCCNPMQLTTCGKCCPAGTTPDPVSGGCNGPSPIQ